MKILNKILEIILAILVVIMVLGCCWQVITRFVLSKPSKYTEEFLRYTLIWLTMLGAPYAYGQNKHLSLYFVTDTFKPKNLIRNELMVEVIVLLLSIAVFIIGGIMVSINSVGQISPALKLPMPLYYIGLPISGILTVMYAISKIGFYLNELKKGGK